MKKKKELYIDWASVTPEDEIELLKVQIKMITKYLKLKFDVSRDGDYHDYVTLTEIGDDNAKSNQR